MKILEDAPGRLRLGGSVDWARLGVGLMFLLLALFIYLTLHISPAKDTSHRRVEGERRGGVTTLTLIQTSPGIAPKTWQVTEAQLRTVNVGIEEERNQQGRVFRTYSLELHLNVGNPWVLWVSYDRHEIDAAKRALDTFLNSPAQASVTVAPARPQKQLPWDLMLITPPTALGVFLVVVGYRVRRFGLLVDAATRTVTVAGLKGGDLALPFADITGVAPFDPRDRQFTGSYTLVLETRSHGGLRLEEIEDPQDRPLEGVWRQRSLDPAEVASARAAHDALADRILALTAKR